MTQIGYMQGRLSPIVNGMIQAFPWDTWQGEFEIASSIGLNCMEWTLDQDRLYENPLMTSQGQTDIKALCQKWNFIIPSLTGDCFMQAPFWKVSGEQRDSLLADFQALIESCSAVGIGLIVIPLVDGGSLATQAEEDLLVEQIAAHYDMLRTHNVKIAYESDYVPGRLATFIQRFDTDLVGINYDSGNSAALGFNPTEEFTAYSTFITNIHIKDRLLGGTTVPLGTGAADLDTVVALIRDMKYDGTLILQTARAEDDQHAKVLKSYKDMMVGLLDGGS